MSWEIHCAKLEDWAASYSGPKFHAVLCDPPYGLEFMGKDWDAPHRATSFPQAGNLGGFADGEKPSFARQKRHLHKLAHIYASWGKAILPLLHPGALVLMFGGTRTWHRLATGMEDAGFEMWDTLMWLYGQGFPKAQKIPDWEGYKTTALKPAWEPILCFKAPNGGKTYAQLASEFGSGCLNVDGGRIATCEADMRDVGRVITRNVRPDDGWGFNGDESDRTEVIKENGRYPANLILDEATAVMLDQQSGNLTSGANPEQRHSDITRGIYGEFKGHECFPARGADFGGASRFFYCAKADRAERDQGLDAQFPVKMLRWSSGDESPGTFQAEGTDKFARNFHPTVKPVDLCAYLATLLLPPDCVKPRRLFIPFEGSGSEIIGALRAGWDEVVGVEQDAEYVRIAKARIVGDAPLFNTVPSKPNPDSVIPLFETGKPQ